MSTSLTLFERLIGRWHDRRLRRSFKLLGEGVIFDPFSTVITPETISIGDQTFIGERAHFSGEITIGRRVMFGPRPIIVAGDHYFGVQGRSPRFLHPQAGENSEPVRIEDEAWCGAAVIITGGVVVGTGCVVGAGSVVTKSLPPYVVAVGNACRPIALIFSDSTLRRHLEAMGHPASDADSVVRRRRSELRAWKLRLTRIVDQTSVYWETRGDRPAASR